MDNQLFPGGNAFLDEVPQVCPLCGLMFNNSLTYQHHMQLHFLSAATNAQMLGTQPPPDPGIGSHAGGSILDLIGTQHTLSSNVSVSLVPQQSMFTGAAVSTIPHHLISPGGGLTTSSVPNIGLPRPTSSRVKEKKTKSQSSKVSSLVSSTSTLTTSTVNLLSTSSSSATFKSSDSSSNTFISTFPKDLQQKIDTLPTNAPNAQQIPPKPSPDIFQASSSQIDPLELLLTSPVKQSTTLDRQLSHNTSSQDSYSVSKETKKLFQPFVSNDTPVSAPFVCKSSSVYNTNSLMSPMKISGTTHDVLTTPQKNYQPSSDNLFSSPTTNPNTHSSDIHHFGILSDNDTETANLDRKIDLPTKVTHPDESVSVKPPYFPGFIDSTNISPKSGQSSRKKDVPVDPLLKMNTLTGSMDHSQSSSPVSRATLTGDFGAARPDSPRTIVSPKVSTAILGGVLDTESASLPSKSHLFTSEVLPSASVPSVAPPVYGNTASANAGVPSLASPAIDMAVNPLGTGYLNALTQKLFNPSFSMGPDFNKPSSSTAAGSADDLKSKSYFENGVLISNDYDKISDTNDEDDLERWIDDIDNKSDNNIACEIEDLLNEFNEKQTDDMKNKNQVDDFIKDVIGDSSTSKPAPKVAEPGVKVDDGFNPSDEFERNKSLISEILEEEKEKIDKESKELENARLSASGLFSTSTSTSTSVTVSSSSTESTFTSVTNSDPKMSSTTSSETPEKKDDDHVDFEIPKVGKLMKIRKYFENREQKRKEQTEKVTEIKIHEKTEPVVENKPQTILVQVSKRKKIEYGPYLNRQSLLEGKPKNAETTSPPKTYRPKPKPQLPEKRTFNLRERKTKTDFATLASTGSRTSDNKRPEQKPKTNEKGEKEKSNEETVDVTVEEKDEKSEDAGTESKIVTRNQEKKIESNVEEKTSKGRKGNAKTCGEAETVKVKETDEASTENGGRKFSLRNRSAKNDKSDVVEGKNLRKRTMRSETDGNRSKVKKTEDSDIKSAGDTEEKVTRSKSKSKTTVSPNDKSGIKKCSVNLGEKYTDPKFKMAKLLDKQEKKDGGNAESKNIVKGTDENEGEEIDEKGELIANLNKSDNSESGEPTNKESVVEENMDISHENTTYESSQKDNVKDESNQESDVKEDNIFDKMDQPEGKRETKDIFILSKKAESQMVSITSTDNTDKKVTMKLRLGPDFQKAFENAFNPKKRKFLSVDEPEVKPNIEPVKEDISDDENETKDILEDNKMFIDGDNNEKEQVSSDDASDSKVEKKTKHSVENEFQRLVDEAMKEAQKEGDSGKQERYVNLRRRLNENVKYNVDDSDDDVDKTKILSEDIGAKSVVKTPKSQTKGATPKAKFKQEIALSDSSKNLTPKKDVDVYDFTDTEMSDNDESAPKKLGFKPKYVSNLNLFGQKKLPFVSKPLSPGKSPDVEILPENENATVSDSANIVSDIENTGSEISYVGKTVEPLKIKLTKIKPFKEKRHKHKKKKKKKDKERREDDIDKIDSGESRESMDVDSDKLTNANTEVKKIEEVKSVESINLEPSSNNSNEVEDEPNESGINTKGWKKTKLKEKKHICEYCNVGFGQKCDLRRHIMIHTGERPWPCEICDKRFQRKTDLVKHTRTHTGEKPYACEFCDKRVSDKSQLNVHRRLHTGDRPYCCSICGKRCITSSELARHKGAHCGEKSIERCSLCKKVFTIKECLGMHMKLHYRSRGKVYKCEKCAIGFDKKQDLDSHHCVDPLKNVYMCSECYEEFNDELLYAEHIKTHDLGVLACNVCTNIFDDKHSLETHLCSLGVEKQRQFCCEICDLEFQDSDALSSHLTLHDEDVGSFMCELCPEIFTVRKLFVEHSKVHESMAGNVLKPDSSMIETKPIQSTDVGIENVDFLKTESPDTDSRLKGPFTSRLHDTIENSDFTSGKQDTTLIGSDNLPVTVKSEILDLNFPCAGNRSRASVISGTFRIDDEPDTKHLGSLNRYSKSNMMSDSATGLSKGNSDMYSVRSNDFLDSGKLFEPSDFSNSPDFSTLTDVDDLNPFEGLSDTISKDTVTKSAKFRHKTNDRGNKSVGYFDPSQKLSQFSNSSQSFGFTPSSSQCLDVTVDNSSSKVLQKHNSHMNSIQSSDTSTSSDISQYSLSEIPRSLTGDHNFQQHEPHGKTTLSSSQNKQWSSYSMSASDFVNSVLSNENKSDLSQFDSSSINTKQTQLIQGLSKSDINDVPSRGHMYSKDNIENQLKSEIFSDFAAGISNIKSTIHSDKHNVSSASTSSNAGSFQGLNRGGFGLNRFHQSFSSEKSDLSVFGQQYVNQYPGSTSYSTINNSALTNSVTSDVNNKRHLHGIFSNRSESSHNNFYLSDSMKEVTGTDKSSDDTATLLSNFDQF
ncbi:hypothetical protein ACF0H5_019653 [Mactra antiquata]